MNVHKICTWAQGHLPFLRKNLRLTGGIASEATFSRMLASIDEYELAELFMTWVAEILRLKGIHVVIDGKALRAAAEKNENKKPPYVLNALDAATKLVIAQLPIMDKSCEKSRIPDLLSYLCDSSTDETFTIDAIGTDDEIMRKINENGCSFVFTLKKNNPAKYEEAIDVFRDFIREEDKKKRNPPSLGEERVDIYDDYQSMITLERNRDRYECR
ncbi:MAG TPA: ISAs1 family transposase, partial [Lachnospiraceae bacterium]|nr:ISAs1 family transposase [Lachnospiraceae bacterium]